MYLLFNLIICTIITTTFYNLIKKKLKIAIIFYFISMYLANVAFGLIGNGCLIILTASYFFWCNYFLNKNWQKAFKINMVIVSIYTAIQSIDLVLKIILHRGPQDIFLKASTIFMGLFFIASVIEMKKLIALEMLLKKKPAESL